jgi:hypothetical protein
LRRNHKPGAERFQGVDGRWWLRHQVIDKKSLPTRDFCLRATGFTFHQMMIGNLGYKRNLSEAKAEGWFGIGSGLVGNCASHRSGSC